MKGKTKEFLKKYLIGFILGLVSVGIVAVYAETYFPSNDVTYDNTESGLSSTDVQGAIDELYGVCTAPVSAGDGILDNTDIVTSGDGLYEDEYEEGKYTYKGANPNNYVTFNNEEAGWRIISINSDGTIKIMRTESIGTMTFDTSGGPNGSNNWARPADLNTYLNGTYYNGLTQSAKGQIVAKDWSIGAISDFDTDLVNTINMEDTTKWNGKIALITASEYVRSNSNKDSCGTMQQLLDATNGQCKGTTWMYYSGGEWWTLSPSLSYTVNFMIIVYGNSGAFNTANRTFTAFMVRPALYLSSEVKLTGSGTQSDPYVVN